jgi:hypothetical protein
MPYQYVREPLTGEEANRLANACERVAVPGFRPQPHRGRAAPLLRLQARPDLHLDRDAWNGDVSWRAGIE